CASIPIVTTTIPLPERGTIRPSSAHACVGQPKLLSSDAAQPGEPRRDTHQRNATAEPGMNLQSHLRGSPPSPSAGDPRRSNTHACASTDSALVALAGARRDAPRLRRPTLDAAPAPDGGPTELAQRPGKARARGEDIHTLGRDPEPLGDVDRDHELRL